MPAPIGAHNWQPMAYNPKTGLVYIPAMQPMGIFALSKEFKDTGKYTRRDMFWNPGIDWNAFIDTVQDLMTKIGGPLPPDRGFLKAWDPIQKKTVWEIEHPAFWSGGLLTTPGNLLFQGTGHGRFVAYAAVSGRILWAVPTMVGIVAPPVTYEAGGEQYVGVMAGYGGGGAVTAGDPRAMASAKYVNMKVKAYDSLGVKKAQDSVDSPFTIEVIKVTSANGGEYLKSGTTANITWSTNATKRPVAKVKLFFSKDGGTTWILITTLTGNPGTYPWLVPLVGAVKSQSMVKVDLRDSAGASLGIDTSNAFLTIQP